LNNTVDSGAGMVHKEDLADVRQTRRTKQGGSGGHAGVVSEEKNSRAARREEFPPIPVKLRIR